MIPTEQILALLETPGIGRKTVQRVLEGAVSAPLFPDGYLEILADLKKTFPRTRLPGKDELLSGMGRAAGILKAAAGLDIRVVGFHDSDYLTTLKTIPDPPVILFVKGDVCCLSDAVAIAVVGTRTPTNYGAGCANAIGRQLASMGVVVVAGLAVGCDTAGHLGCLKGNGKTVAVLAHGLDTVYPAQNVRLAAQIVEAGGCLISEYPVGEPLLKTRLVERDRLQSGLCQGVIVIETDIRGGTMHTVGFCEQQGRLLGCLVPQSDDVIHPQSRGNLLLLGRAGTRPIAGKEDLPGFVQECRTRLSGLPTKNGLDPIQKRLFR